MRMSLTGERFASTQSVDLMIKDAVQRLKTVPGVENASASCCIPLEGGYGLPYQVVGRPLTDGPFHGAGGWVTVSPGYFEVFKIGVRRGRTFNDGDRRDSQPVAVISQAMARRYWPGGDALGRILRRPDPAEPDLMVVGVASVIRRGATPGLADASADPHAEDPIAAALGADRPSWRSESPPSAAPQPPPWAPPGPADPADRD